MMTALKEFKLFRSGLIALCLVGVGFLLLPSISLAQTPCICQTGTRPAYQTPLFKLGCKQWLREQTGCSSKQIVPMPDFQKKVSSYDLPPTAPGSTLTLGYVGHWGSTIESQLYIFNVVLPTLNRYDINVVVDNTGCKGAEQPQVLVSYGRASPMLYPNNRWVEYRANQADSFGVWDRFGMSKSLNFWASVHLPDGKITYPNCQQFEAQTCSIFNQKHAQAICLSAEGQPKTLQCCSDTPSEGMVQSSRSKWFWTDAASPLCRPPPVEPNN
ncbi:MAG: hypothetical protein EOP06_19915 [Proteobacteria bacterium]|nr:MAG: hypothetical protein EOP06_19915 [Pseudomonadota bacterium]